MNKEYVEYSKDLTVETVSGVKGLKLCAFLVALEGWRRGLTLKWYAENHGLDIKRVGTNHLGRIFSLHDDENKHFFYRSRGDLVSKESVNICQFKERTKELLMEANISVPEGRKFDASVADEEMMLYASSLGFPVVLKPTSGSMGRGVYTNLQNIEELKAALQDLRTEYKYTSFIIERYLPGNEYRVYVVGDQVIAATNRIPANVVGDGKSSIKALISRKNKERKKNPYLASKPIKVDFEVEQMLKVNGYTLDSIVENGETVFLRQKSNLSSGGDPIDVTDELSDEVKQIAINSLKALPSIPHAGVDIIVDPSCDKKGYIIEINATAEIGFHLFPLKGKFRDVPRAIIDYYFPKTINNIKSTMYFDYESILAPLTTMSANEVEVINAPTGYIYKKAFKVKGKLSKVGYLSFVKKEAKELRLHGFVKTQNDKSVLVVATAQSIENLETLKQLLLQGTEKSVVEDVQEILMEQPVLMGFALIKEDEKTIIKKKKGKVSKNKKVKVVEKPEVNIVKKTTGLKGLIRKIIK